jgi:hypothetical protein
MALKLDGYIDLPAHVTLGGFDDAAIHERTRRLYVFLPKTHQAAVFDDR